MQARLMDVGMGGVALGLLLATFHSYCRLGLAGWSELLTNGLAYAIAFG